MIVPDDFDELPYYDAADRRGVYPVGKMSKRNAGRKKTWRGAARSKQIANSRGGMNRRRARRHTS